MCPQLQTLKLEYLVGLAKVRCPPCVHQFWPNCQSKYSWICGEVPGSRKGNYRLDSRLNIFLHPHLTLSWAESQCPQSPVLIMSLQPLIIVFLTVLFRSLTSQCVHGEKMQILRPLSLIYFSYLMC